MKATYVYGKLPAQDIERARRFYQEKRGLRPYAENDKHLYYEVGGVRFVIFPSSGAPSGTHDQLGFVVDDLEHEIAELRSQEVVFEEYPGLTKDGVMAAGSMKAAWFRDSEGNLVSVTENPALMTLQPSV